MLLQYQILTTCFMLLQIDSILAYESNRKLLRSEDQYKIAVKASVPWDRSRQEFPCVPETSPHTQGIFYVKVPNTASTDLAAITERFAKREAIRQNKESCKVHDTKRFLPAYIMNVRDRDKRRSYLWSMVRNPSSSAINYYARRIQSGGIAENNYNSFITVLEDDSYAHNSQLRFLSSISSPAQIPEDQYRSYIRSVIDEYDFIGVYERMHESLVVLAMLIGVDTNDMLFNYSEEGCPGKEKTEPEWLTPAMMCYLDTNEWKTREMGDFLLHDAINRSLDFTIERLGREKVQKALDRYERSLLIGRKVYGKQKGCGIPNLASNPYADPSEFHWFQRLSPDDRAVMNNSNEFDVDAVKTNRVY